MGEKPFQLIAPMKTGIRPDNAKFANGFWSRTRPFTPSIRAQKATIAGVLKVSGNEIANWPPVVCLFTPLYVTKASH